MAKGEVIITKDFDSGGREFRDHLNRVVARVNDHDKRLNDIEQAGKGGLVTAIVVLNGVAVYFAVNGDVKGEVPS